MRPSKIDEWNQNRWRLGLVDGACRTGPIPSYLEQARADDNRFASSSRRFGPHDAASSQTQDEPPRMGMGPKTGDQFDPGWVRPAASADDPQGLKMFNDAARAAGITTPEMRRDFHDAISGQGITDFGKLLDVAGQVKAGTY